MHKIYTAFYCDHLNPAISCPSVLFTGVWSHELSVLLKIRCVFSLLLKLQFKDTESIIVTNTEVSKKYKLLAQQRNNSQGQKLNEL